MTTILERIDQKISNMKNMLIRYGIDPPALAQRKLAVLFRASMRACQTCPNGELCQIWLQAAGPRIERIPEFCPNGRRFEDARAALGAGSH